MSKTRNQSTKKVGLPNLKQILAQFRIYNYGPQRVINAAWCLIFFHFSAFKHLKIKNDRNFILTGSEKRLKDYFLNFYQLIKGIPFTLINRLNNDVRSCLYLSFSKLGFFIQSLFDPRLMRYSFNTLYVSFQKPDIWIYSSKKEIASQHFKLNNQVFP